MERGGAWGVKSVIKADAWRTMPYPLIIDSGAAETVLPEEWFTDHSIIEATEKEKEENWFIAADGGEVRVKGSKTLLMAMLDGSEAVRTMDFTVCGVNKALGSVSRICSRGNRVVFDTGAGNSYIESKKTGERINLRESNGTYVLDVAVAPPDMTKESFKEYDWSNFQPEPYASGFGRQGK